MGLKILRGSPLLPSIPQPRPEEEWVCLLYAPEEVNDLGLSDQVALPSPKPGPLPTQPGEEPPFLSSCTRLLGSLGLPGQRSPPFSELPPRTVDTWGPSTLVPVDCSCWRLLHRPISCRSEEMKDLSYVPFPTLVTMESKEGLRRDSWQLSHIQDNETEAKVREMVCLD